MRTKFNVSIILCGVLLSATVQVLATAEAQTSTSSYSAVAGKSASSTLPVQAAITSPVTTTVPFGQEFSCADSSRVLIGYVINGQDRTATITCGQVSLDGGSAKTEDEEEPGKPYNVISAEIFYADADRVTTLFYPEDSLNLKASTSKLVDQNGDYMNVRSEAEWRRDPEFLSKVECPKDMAVVAIDWRFDRYICATIWQGNPKPPSPGGVISFRSDEELPCAIPVPNGPRKQVTTHMLHARLAPCKADAATSIEFEKVPSATYILLTDVDSCSRSMEDYQGHYPSFWIELRTIEKSVTISKMNLDEFFSFSPGDIVSKGVKLIDAKRRGSEEAVKKLSCVQITTSSAPPTS